MDRFMFCACHSNMASPCIFRLQPNMKCIIFVNRIVTARSLSYILQSLEFLASWKGDFLVGVNAGLKGMSRKTMNTILDRFRSGEVMLKGFLLTADSFALMHINLSSCRSLGLISSIIRSLSHLPTMRSQNSMEH